MDNRELLFYTGNCFVNDVFKVTESSESGRVGFNRECQGKWLAAKRWGSRSSSIPNTTITELHQLDVFKYCDPVGRSKLLQGARLITRIANVSRNSLNHQGATMPSKFQAAVLRVHFHCGITMKILFLASPGKVDE